MRGLAAILLFGLSLVAAPWVSANAQCVPPGGGPATIAACPPAVDFQPTDVVLGWQYSPKGHTVRVESGQIAGGGATGFPITLPPTTSVPGVPQLLSITQNGFDLGAFIPPLHQDIGTECSSVAAGFNSLCRTGMFLSSRVDHRSLRSGDQSVLTAVQFGTGVGGAVNSNYQFGLRAKFPNGADITHVFKTSDVPWITNQTDLARAWSIYRTGGLVWATIANGGSGLATGQILALDTGTPGQPGFVYCQTPPRVVVTASGGVATSVLPDLTTNPQGGGCDAALPDPVSVTGGNGLTLHPHQGWYDLEAQYEQVLDDYGIGHRMTGVYQNPDGGVIGDWNQFDKPFTVWMQACPDPRPGGNFCGVGGQTINAVLGTFQKDNIPHDNLVGAPSNLAGTPIMTACYGDQGPNYRLIGSSGPASGNVNLGWVGSQYGSVLTASAQNGLPTATTLVGTIGAPLILTIPGHAGVFTNLPTGFTGTTNYRLCNKDFRNSVSIDTYIYKIVANGGDTDLWLVGTISAPGITAGDQVSVTDVSNIAGELRLLASTGVSLNKQVFQAGVGGWHGGMWVGLPSKGPTGSPSMGQGTLNLQDSLWIDSQQVIDSSYMIDILNGIQFPNAAPASGGTGWDSTTTHGQLNIISNAACATNVGPAYNFLGHGTDGLISFGYIETALPSCASNSSYMAFGVRTQGAFPTEGMRLNTKALLVNTPSASGSTAALVVHGTIETQGTDDPTPSTGTGAGATILAGNNNTWRATIGTGPANPFSFTFPANVWTNAPVCTATNEGPTTGTPVLYPVVGVSTTQIDVHGLPQAADVVAISCHSYQ